MTMKINVIETRKADIIEEPSTKKQWAVAIGLLIILAYILGYLITDCLMK